ncbi:hypothetical protein EHQ27_13795 [Leptospira wolffii]|uniref:hypothetical protein n=1 Tax=Leptospira wolffii TaxID=409998 RepID=UPI001082E5DF|nr:hypothetical protein [Leptospira wolffii]TGK62075.1 hypothetical protein EHQ32_04350 [Leptospira wolffii]TGK68677.1 hypothetical protein EHQ27_13795 [Leptospira wolffii]TGK74539.1 hypothetical protein EHQ35_09425 [Leptospira wolffii]TGL31885.1 hypothetical protein EHQ57_03250 [Leptospira wolffii]
MKEYLSNLTRKFLETMKEIFSKKTLEKLNSIFRERILKDPQVGIPTAFGIVFLSLGFYFLFKGYSIDLSIQDPALLIPKKANLLIEVYRPEDFLEDVEKTGLGKQLSENGVFRKLFTLPELKKVSSVLYLLEAKAGVMTEPSRLSALFDGPVSAALFPESKWILVGKASPSSKLGVSLITAIKGEKVVVQPASKEEKTPTQSSGEEGEYQYGTPTGSQETHSADDFTDQFAASSEKFGNLQAFKYAFSEEEVYIIVIGDFLILSNSKDILESSLNLASNSDNDSLGNQKGFATLRKAAARKENKILFYAGSDSFFAPLLRPFFGNSGAGLLLGWKDGSNLEGKIFRIGGEAAQVISSEPSLSKAVSRDANLVFHSEELRPSDFWKTWESFGDDWESFSRNFTSFGTDSGIHDQYFGSGKGMALVYHGLDSKPGMVYPRFGIALPSSVPDDKLLKAVFKVGTPTKQQFQNVFMDTYSSGKGGYYSPTSVKISGWKYLSSDRKSAEENISAGNGNRPSLADLFSGSEFKEFAYYPHHISIRVPGILEDLRTFYLYGAEGSSEYTSKTIDRDIQPLLDLFRPFERLLISFGSGKEGEEWGRLKVSSN